MESIQVHRTRTLTPLSLSNLCAQYLQNRFCFILNTRRSSINFNMAPEGDLPKMLPMHLASELDCIARTLVDAFLNPSQCIIEAFQVYILR
jgi:hypothetical protein